MSNREPGQAASQPVLAAAQPESMEADPSRRWFAAGGVIGAILASTCCIGPLVLAALGVSGAWIGNLTALEPFKPVFAVIALIFIGFGFRHVYLRPKAKCEGGACARRESSAVTQAGLWIATALVVLALTIDWWAKFFY